MFDLTQPTDDDTLLALSDCLECAALALLLLLALLLPVPLT